MRTTLLVALVIAAPAVANADAISGPPACPPGARGASSHAGQWCQAWTCSTDAECDGGSCRPWRVCTRTSMVPPGGRGGFDQPPRRMDLVVGTCEPARACTGTEEPPPAFAGTFEPGDPTCTEATFCVPASLPPLPARPSTSPPTAVPSSPHSPPPAPVSARGCACSAVASRAGFAPAAIALIAIAVAMRRRR